MNIIYIFPYSLTAWDADRFGFQFLLDSGVNLKVLDLSALVCTRSTHNVTLLTDKYLKKIHSYDELENELKATADNSIYIDNINGINGFQWQSRKIFKLFKKYHVKYYLIEIGSLPLLANSQANIFNKLKKLFQFKKLYAYTKWKLGKMLAHYQWQHLQAFSLPEKIFIGNSEMLDQYLTKYHYNPKQIVPVHSYDYDKYLKYFRQHPLTSENQEKTCVFLDQMLATHSDFGKNASFSPVTAEKYLASLNKFFDLIEKKLALKIIIAASPRSQYETTPGIFGNRTVIKDKTLELVAKSSLVLLHTTTAVSFAILFDKPILLLRTAEMVNAPGYGNFLNNMAHALNLKPVDIDDEAALQKLDLENYPHWQRRYDNYKYKYVMTHNAKPNTIWEILLQELSTTSLLRSENV